MYFFNAYPNLNSAIIGNDKPMKQWSNSNPNLEKITLLDLLNLETVGKSPTRSISLFLYTSFQL